MKRPALRQPAGLQPGQLVATASVAQANRELVADKSAATVGEDRRATGEACAVLLAFAGGRASEPPTVRSYAEPDRTAPDSHGTERAVESAAESVYQERGEERCCESGLESGAFRP